MNIILNNESDEVHDGITIKELLDDKKIHTQYIAIEINKKIIPKSSYYKHEFLRTTSVCTWTSTISVCVSVCECV